MYPVDFAVILEGCIIKQIIQSRHHSKKIEEDYGNCYQKLWFETLLSETLFQEITIKKAGSRHCYQKPWFEELLSKTLVRGIAIRDAGSRYCHQKRLFETLPIETTVRDITK